MRWISLGTGGFVIAEGRIGADEGTVLDYRTIPEVNTGFDRDIVADHHFVFDEGVRADVAVPAYSGIG
ncbi:hypothetical protein D3C80_2211890 [compost metagenome]